MRTLASAQPDQSQEELVARAQAEDAEAFRQLFDHFYPMIYAFCYRSCLDQAQAQDIAQETFIKAARSLGVFRREASFKSWVYGIAANTIRDWLRERSRRNRLAEAMTEKFQENAAHREPDHSHVTEALRALPDDLRLAIVLTFYEGMNHAAAAKVLGCAETTVSWRVFRAKRQLKTILSRKET